MAWFGKSNSHPSSSMGMGRGSFFMFIRVGLMVWFVKSNSHPSSKKGWEKGVWCMYEITQIVDGPCV
jgi:hypothetical protein